MEMVNQELAKLIKIIEAKNSDYTAGSDDPFANFRLTETLELGTAETGLLIRMVDKIQRVKSFIQQGELKVQNESAADAARDIIGYSLILIGLMHDRQQQKHNDYVHSLPTRGGQSGAV